MSLVVAASVMIGVASSSNGSLGVSSAPSSRLPATVEGPNVETQPDAVTSPWISAVPIITMLPFAHTDALSFVTPVPTAGS